MKYAIIGYGSRGKNYHYQFDLIGADTLVAACDIRKCRLDLIKDESIQKFDTDTAFFAAGKLADVCVVSTPDGAHVKHALAALDLGYDLLLEKPIACNMEDVLAIYRKAKQLNRKVFVCHVLRYAPFFYQIKKLLQTGEYGKVMTVNATESVGFWHQAHSYVRGNWHDTKETSPMIIAKCCHDLDILNWLIDDECQTVSSMGSLSYFNAAHAPKDAGKTCYECPHINDCIYSCEKFYWEDNLKKGNRRWPVDVVCDDENIDHEMLTKALKNSDYCKCVYACDNDAVDHQVVNLLYKEGATAHLTMTAFGQGGRFIHVHCEKGEISGCTADNILHTNIFGKRMEDLDVSKMQGNDVMNFGHGGGDYLLCKDVSEQYRGLPSAGLTTIEQSISSHTVGFTAEKSRLLGGALLEVKE